MATASKDRMNILVTLDSNYVLPLKVMLTSLFLNNPRESFSIFLIHSSLDGRQIEEIDAAVRGYGQILVPIRIGETDFEDAPVLLHYTKAMYYRLLAFKYLPADLDRILYLDPDILVINPVRPLYNTDMDDCLYAAAYHDLPARGDFNKLRLYPYPIKAYYNSGVLLMNLALQRRDISEAEIFDFVRKNWAKLIMPDQDVLNALYAERIKSVDEKIYNFDVRYHRYYRLVTNGECDMDFIIGNTVILHFCGKKKPWQRNYAGQFLPLYKHYQKLAAQIPAHQGILDRAQAEGFRSASVRHPAIQAPLIR
jgi:lipopolysaccharide biosynthesis glycosyltransferase